MATRGCALCNAYPSLNQILGKFPVNFLEQFEQEYRAIRARSRSQPWEERGELVKGARTWQRQYWRGKELEGKARVT